MKFITTGMNSTYLRCPITGEPLELEVFERDGDRIAAGVWVAATSRYVYPVIDDVPFLSVTPRPTSVAFLAQWANDPRFPGDSKMPFHAMEEAPELEHYEVNGLELDAQAGFENDRMNLTLSLLPEDVGSVLEVGTGPGLFLSRIEAHRPELTVFGVERSEAAIHAAVCDGPLFQGEADRLPFPDGSVDCVISMKTLEHLPVGVFEAALSEMARVSRRYLLINVPYRERRLQAVCPSCGCAFNPNYHVRTFDDRSLDGLFADYRVVSRVHQPRPLNLLAAVAAPFRQQVFGGFVDHAICPQCGYRRDRPSGGGTQASAGRSFRSLVRCAARCLPTVGTRGDIVLLYERRPHRQTTVAR